MREAKRFSGDGVWGGDGGADSETEATLENAVELSAFVGDERIGGKGGEFRAQGEEGGDVSGEIFFVEVGEGGRGEGIDFAPRAWVTRSPRSSDAFEKTGGCGSTAEQRKGLGAWAARTCAAALAEDNATKILGFMLGENAQ